MLANSSLSQRPAPELAAAHSAPTGAHVAKFSSRRADGCWGFALRLALLALSFGGFGCSGGSDGGAGGGGGSDGGASTGGQGSPTSGGGSDGGGSSSQGGSANVGGGAASGGANGGAGSGGRGSGGNANNGGGPATGGGSGTGGAGSLGEGDVVAQGVRWMGRVDTAGAATRFAWSGTGFEATFTGTEVKATLRNDDGYLFQVVVDGERNDTFLATKGAGEYTLASQLSAGTHTLQLLRQTEGQNGNSELVSLAVTDGELGTPPPGPGQVLEIIGDSISCGYGNLGPDRYCPFSFDTESHYDAYGSVAARLLDVDVHTIAISGHGVIRNYDGGTDNLLPEVYQRTLMNQANPAWTFPVEPRAIVINLGTNDFATGDPGTAFEDAYWTFLSDLHDLHPDAYLLATLGPMLSDSNGSLSKARTYIQNAVSALEDDGAQGKVGFLEYPVQIDEELGCDWHPNVKKHKTMGEALAQKLQELKLY